MAGSLHNISPQILNDLRTSSGMSEEEVAKKLNLPKSKYRNIENGVEKLSTSNLVHLADIYKRPLIAFYSFDIEKEPEMPHDYRLNRDKKLSNQVFLAKRKAIYLAKQLQETTNIKTNLPKVNINSTSKELADYLRDTLKVDLSILKDLQGETIFSFYKSIIEEKFFIPVIEHPLKTNGVRALSIYADVCAVVLNESDTGEIKLFSLFHELCHLLRRQDGVCTVDIEKDKQNQPEERYCDEFAAYFLLPEKDLKNELGDRPLSLQELNRLSKGFGVSKTVILIHLKDLNLVNERRYKLLKTQIESLRKSGFGRRNWERTYINRTSRLVLNNLINSFKRGDLTYTDLATITSIKDKYLQKMI